MKTFVTTVLLLAPSLTVSAALVFDPENCCTAYSRVEDADTLNNQGAQLYAAGDYANAGKTLRQALAIEHAQTNPNPALLAGTLFNLAAVARMECKLPEAEALYQRAIAIRESASGTESPELAHPLTGLALVYLSDGRTAQAMELAQRAVRLSKNLSDVQSMATAQNTLATLMMAQGDSRKAETLAQEVVDELRRNSATGTQEYVDALTNLGTARLRLANYRQAELDLREAEAAALKVAGPDHPLTATVWNNLAKVRASQGDWRTAEVLFEKAIAVWRRRWDHPIPTLRGDSPTWPRSTRAASDTPRRSGCTGKLSISTRHRWGLTA